MKINKLQINFIGAGEVQNFEFTQINESEKGYVYLVKNDNTKHYEIFEKKTTPLCIDFENRVYSTSEYKEIYPKSKDFGNWAWTCKSIEKANKLLENIKDDNQTGNN